MTATPSFFAFIVESKRPQRNSKGAVEVQQGGRRGTARRLRKNSKEAAEEPQRGRRGTPKRPQRISVPPASSVQSRCRRQGAHAEE